MRDCLAASGCEVTTVAVRRERLIDKEGQEHPRFPRPEEADDPAEHRRLLQCGGRDPPCPHRPRTAHQPRQSRGRWVKLECLADPKTLLPDPSRRCKPRRQLVKEGFQVLVYTSDDPIMARRLKAPGRPASCPPKAESGTESRESGDGESGTGKRDRKRDSTGRKAGQGQESGTGTILTRWGVLDYGSAMPRTARVAPGGMVFHVLNRGVARMQLFEKAADYQAFEQVLRDTLDQSPMRICAYAVMPNHWHLLLWPECDGELAAFMQRLTITHVRRWQEHRGYAGLGHVYQGRYKSFPVESDEHFWVVARYVERNALRPISSCERRNGGGQACGNAVILREKSGRCWRRGRSICQRIGSSGSIKPTTRRNWKRFAGACNEAAPLASRNGRRKSRNVWA